jgi:hypothetical protein
MVVAIMGGGRWCHRLSRLRRRGRAGGGEQDD